MRSFCFARLAFAASTLVVASLLPRAALASGSTCPMGNVVEGVDVYSGDGTIDWKQVAGAGIGFAYIKATQGNYVTDDSFQTNWTGSKAAGVMRGAYHFFDPNVDGVVQANYFLGVVGTIAPGDLPPMLDIECPDGDPNCLGGASGAASSATITKAMNDFLTTVEAKTGRKPGIYSYETYFSDNKVVTTGLASLPLYIADPDQSPGTCFTFPDPWTEATFWQWTFHGRVPGIGGGTQDVDRDRFIGSLAQLATFAGGLLPPAQVNGNGALSLVTWPDGHTQLFAASKTGDVMHLETNGATGAWSQPASLGAGGCDVASVMWSPASGKSAEVWNARASGVTSSAPFDAAKGWPAFAPDGGKNLSSLSTLAFSDGHVEAFALGSDGAIWHDAGSMGTFAGWVSLGGSFVTGVAPIVWGDGHAEIFATDKNGVVFHNYTNTATPPSWQGWSQIGGAKIASRPIAARWADGHVVVLARSAANHIAISDYTKDAWPNFTELNSTQEIQGEPSVLVYPSYGPEVFARDPKGALLHMWNTSGAWSAWSSDFNETLASDPMAWLRSDGTGEVFGVDTKGDLVVSVHASTTWTAFTSLGAGFDTCVEASTSPEGGVPFDGPDAGATNDAGGPLDGADTTDSSSGGCACSAAGHGGNGANGAEKTGLLATLSLGLVLSFRARRRRTAVLKFARAVLAWRRFG